MSTGRLGVAIASSTGSQAPRLNHSRPVHSALANEQCPTLASPVWSLATMPPSLCGGKLITLYTNIVTQRSFWWLLLLCRLAVLASVVWQQLVAASHRSARTCVKDVLCKAPNIRIVSSSTIQYSHKRSAVMNYMIVIAFMDPEVSEVPGQRLHR